MGGGHNGSQNNKLNQGQLQVDRNGTWLEYETETEMSFSITQSLPTEPSRHRLTLINSIKSHRDSFCHPVALSFILSISFYLLPIICLHFNHFSVCIWTHLADAWYLLTLVSRVQLIHSTCWKLRHKLRSAYLTALNVPLYRQYTHTHCKGHGNQLAFSPALN